MANPPQLAVLMLIITLVNAIYFVSMRKVSLGWTVRQQWWPRAAVLQKQLMTTLGYSEEAQTPAAVLDMWSFVLVASIHHGSMGLLTLPVIVGGWEGNASGQLLFCIAVLGEIGFDMFDFLRMTILGICPSVFPGMSPVPPAYYLLTSIHHALSIVLGIPMLLWFGHRWEVQWIASSLLLATAASFITGAYKFTLDTSECSDFCKYKAIVVFQFAVIWCSRCCIWFYASISLCMHLWGANEMSVFRVAVLIVGGFSLFNLAILVDATTAAIKWLPRSRPQPKKHNIIQVSDDKPSIPIGSDAPLTKPSNAGVLLGSEGHRIAESSARSCKDLTVPLLS